MKAGIRLTIVACACSLAAVSAAEVGGPAPLPLLAPAPSLNIDGDYPPAVKVRIARAEVERIRGIDREIAAAEHNLASLAVKVAQAEEALKAAQRQAAEGEGLTISDFLAQHGVLSDEAYVPPPERRKRAVGGCEHLSP